jgi:hypothetical protein
MALAGPRARGQMQEIDAELGQAASVAEALTSAIGRLFVKRRRVGRTLTLWNGSQIELWRG